MRHINTYVCLVDGGGPIWADHSTQGRYYVGAKSEKEAKKLLQKAIGFGSIDVCYIAQPGGFDPILSEKIVRKAVWLKDLSVFATEDVVHATAPRRRNNGNINNSN